MKNFLFILFLLPVISHCQTDSEFVFQNSIEVDWDEYYCINESYCFFLDLDTSDDQVTMYYSLRKNGNKQTLEIMDISGLTYGSDLNIYKNKTDNSYIVIWKRESEFAPSFYVYYIKKGILKRIGEWGITEPCDTCDTGDYSIENIRIYQRDNEIEFSFLADANFVIFKEDYHYDDLGTFEAGELKISFNTVDGLLKVIEKVK